ncbi:hypothetical protein TNCV_553381 [Trichonephila clavipes]|nr:hypothetical protein TNCV_553381 [Trichonephila clavipes]
MYSPTPHALKPNGAAVASGIGLGSNCPGFILGIKADSPGGSLAIVRQMPRWQFRGVSQWTLPSKLCLQSFTFSSFVATVGHSKCDWASVEDLGSVCIEHMILSCLE